MLLFCCLIFKNVACLRDFTAHFRKAEGECAALPGVIQGKNGAVRYPFCGYYTIDFCL